MNNKLELTPTMKAVAEMLIEGKKLLKQHEALCRKAQNLYQKNGNGCLFIHSDEDYDRMSDLDHQMFNDAQRILNQITDIICG